MGSTETVKQQFGRRVRALRQAHGWSQERLAAEASLHVTYVSGVERGRRNVSIENIAKIAEALDVPIGDLFEDDGHRAMSTARLLAAAFVAAA